LYIVNIFYCLCSQEVEEETGSAEEQPVSNKLPALRCNFFFGVSTRTVSFFSSYRQRFPWLKKPAVSTVFLEKIKNPVQITFYQ
jgi:hypothetical protein